MTWDQIEGQGSRLKGKAQERVAAALDATGGKRDPFFVKLHEKYSLAKEEAEAERRIDEWRNSLRL